MMMHRTRLAGLRFVAVGLLLAVSVPAGFAFQGGQRPAVTPAPGAGAKAPAPPPIGAEQALYLVRSTLMALNDANRTGNYTVLRDMAAPDFQARNTSADLSVAFTDLRRRNLDLFAVALINPTIETLPALDKDGRLRLSGYFPTRPLQIKFDLTFALSAGQWKLFAIAVSTPQSPATPASAPPKR
jgi:hypothetical protein